VEDHDVGERRGAEATLRDRRVVVTGGSRGLGLAIVQALVARGAQVTVVARDRASLAAVERPGVTVWPGDVTDPALMRAVVGELRPSALILNAGATPFMAPLHEQSWESFSRVWNTDVKAGLLGVQAALAAPLPRGSRVMIVSSGAALKGAALAGGYAGAKRELWFMAHHANDIARERDLGIRFQVLVPTQMYAETALMQEVAGAYARRQGQSVEAYVAARYGEVISAGQYGEHVATLLADPACADGVAYGVRGGSGITCLDEKGATQ
jgi:NAD(P)-dependent dehydrogenase (short-subunit alcohol dehydrogenase family)